VVFSPSVEANELEVKANTHYTNMLNGSMRASLTVVGDPKLVAGRPIKVKVFTPDGDLYFTSGIYTVDTVDHSIAMGNYTSTMQLIRNSGDIGLLFNSQPKRARS
jgi:hypothetical protein